MSAEYQGKTASQVPISQHPVFPAIVALWFAALLGLGSLVLPAALFENLFDATGIAAAVPAAAAPLGVSARILIALVFAVLGVFAGLFIARKVAAAQGGVRPAVRRPGSGPSARRDDAAKRPLSAREDLGMDSFDDPVDAPPSAPIAGRRRALSLTDESEPGDAAEIATPMEDAADDALDLAAFADGAEPAAIAPDETEPPSGATSPAETWADEARTPDTLPPDTWADDPPFANPADALGEPASGEAEPARPFDAAPPPAPAFAAPAGQDQERESARPALADLSIAELVDRFALSLQRAAERREAVSEPVPEPEPEPELEDDLADTSSSARYVPDLGVEAREAPRFAAPGAAPAEPPAASFEAVPAALRPVVPEDDGAFESEDEDLALSLPLARESRSLDWPAHAPAGDSPSDAALLDDSEGEEEWVPDFADLAVDDGCGSLLDIRSQPRDHEFIRFEADPDADPDADGGGPFAPAAVFPGRDERRAAPAADGSPRDAEGAPPPAAARAFDAPPETGAERCAGPVDEAQAERALREALQKLQRLSGAA
ncbi:hypothetical protein V5F89_05260 [Pelagerythrobacter marensis]|uniref:Uncharacterized protein n=1 Tax=Pelagerythrobacter marensis TaxID=543877 RepID=A0ABZ2D5I6_9SPHN